MNHDNLISSTMNSPMMFWPSPIPPISIRASFITSLGTGSVCEVLKAIAEHQEVSHLRHEKKLRCWDDSALAKSILLTNNDVLLLLFFFRANKCDLDGLIRATACGFTTLHYIICLLSLTNFEWIRWRLENKVYWGIKCLIIYGVYR